MEQVNVYKNSAHLYDLDQRDLVTADIPFYLGYAGKFGGGILELGCGTGRIAIPLAEAGYDITALDLSEDINGCLACMREHLNDGGIVIINVFRPFGTLDESWCYPETVQWERWDDATGSKVVKKHWGQRIDIENQIIYPGFAYEVMANNEVVERFADNLALKYYYYEQLTKLLQDAGFRIRKEYGWYDKTPIENGRELIFVCIR
ncbi:class I SAM-dependent methyltransferase [Desulfitobacterium hafniense]|uniref:Methyltransferase domain-containing protein n=1 Tax=Desulfitobacterium hafniense (strain Y51) TaxID=138119 RepID=Q24QX4_DESHY|nr:class I SAM-dependent methyltransferase [Desulfitobacterium hafniense]BAE85568.1 hypothetical protein DSY3779 [Desulfitobacterium hafniense Y51]